MTENLSYLRNKDKIVFCSTIFCFVVIRSQKICHITNIYHASNPFCNNTIFDLSQDFSIVQLGFSSIVCCYDIFDVNFRVIFPEEEKREVDHFEKHLNNPNIIKSDYLCFECYKEYLVQELES